MKIALISLDQKWEDKAGNAQRCEELTSVAAENGAELVIFPEMTLTGYSMNTQLVMEHPTHGSGLALFSALAKANSVAIVAGVVLSDGDKVSNTLVVYSSSGEELSRYAKIHPFSFAGEDKVFTPGRRLTKVKLFEFSIGFSICYDLRFPELYSSLAKDCEVIVNIANWPKRRVRHWRTLLQARAIENQVYMIGVNRTGVDGNGLEYERSSIVVNANGEFLQPVLSFDELEIFEVNRQVLLDYIDGFSTRQDRIPDLYRELI